MRHHCVFVCWSVIFWSFAKAQSGWSIEEKSPMVASAEEEEDHKLLATIELHVGESRLLQSSDTLGIYILEEPDNGSADPSYDFEVTRNTFRAATRYFRRTAHRVYLLNRTFGTGQLSPPKSGHRYTIFFQLKTPSQFWNFKETIFTTPINIENVEWNNINKRLHFKKSHSNGYFQSIEIKGNVTNKITGDYQSLNLTYSNFSLSSTERQSLPLPIIAVIGAFETNLEYYTKAANTRSSSRYLQFRHVNRPGLPVSLAAEGRNYPQENSVMFTWEPPNTQYTDIIFTCVSQSCNEKQNISIIATLPSPLILDDIKSGVMLTYSVYSIYRYPRDPQRLNITSEIQNLQVSTKISSPKNISATYTRQSDSRNIISNTLTIKIVTQLASRAHFSYILIRVDVLSDSEESAEHLISLKGSDLIPAQDIVEGSDRVLIYSRVSINKNDSSRTIQTVHPIPGGKYKFSASAIVDSISQPSPSVNSTVIFEPRPPMNLTLTSRLTDPFISLSWTISSHSIQDKIIIRYCERSEDNRLNCVRDDILTKPVDGEIQHSYSTRVIPSDGTYSIVAIAQSRGKNSTLSNSVEYRIGTPCTHPDGLNGRLATAADNRHRIYYDSHTVYTLICDEGFTLDEPGEGQSNTWRCQKGEWEPGPGCISILNKGNDWKLWLVVAAAAVICSMIGSTLACRAMIKNKKKTSGVEDNQGPYSGYVEIEPTIIGYTGDQSYYGQVQMGKDPTPPLPPRRNTEMSAGQRSFTSTPPKLSGMNTDISSARRKTPSTEYVMEQPKRKRVSSPRPLL